MILAAPRDRVYGKDRFGRTIADARRLIRLHAAAASVPQTTSAKPRFPAFIVPCTGADVAPSCSPRTQVPVPFQFPSPAVTEPTQSAGELAGKILLNLIKGTSANDVQEEHTKQLAEKSQEKNNVPRLPFSLSPSAREKIREELCTLIREVVAQKIAELENAEKKAAISQKPRVHSDASTCSAATDDDTSSSLPNDDFSVDADGRILPDSIYADLIRQNAEFLTTLQRSAPDLHSIPIPVFENESSPQLIH